MRVIAWLCCLGEAAFLFNLSGDGLVKFSTHDVYKLDLRASRRCLKLRKKKNDFKWVSTPELVSSELHQKESLELMFMRSKGNSMYPLPNALPQKNVLFPTGSSSGVVPRLESPSWSVSRVWGFSHARAEAVHAAKLADMEGFHFHNRRKTLERKYARHIVYVALQRSSGGLALPSKKLDVLLGSHFLSSGWLGERNEETGLALELLAQLATFQLSDNDLSFMLPGMFHPLILETFSSVTALRSVSLKSLWSHRLRQQAKHEVVSTLKRRGQMDRLKTITSPGVHASHRHSVLQPQFSPQNDEPSPEQLQLGFAFNCAVAYLDTPFSKRFGHLVTLLYGGQRSQFQRSACPSQPSPDLSGLIPKMHHVTLPPNLASYRLNKRLSTVI